MFDEQVQKLHDRGNGGIEVPASGEVLSDFVNRLVQLTLQNRCNSRMQLVSISGDRLPDSRSCLHHKSIYASQEAAYPGDAVLLPIEIAVRRRGEERVHTRGVSAVASDHVIGRNDVAFRLRHLRAVLDDHALGEEALYGLVVLDEAEVAHHLRPEARIAEVQDRVLDAADVLIDGEPVFCSFRIEWTLVVLRARVAVEVPRRIDEGVHRVCLAARWAAAFWTRRVQKFRDFTQRRAALLRDLDIVGQQHWQLVVRNGNDAVLLAVKHRNGRAPVALATYAPVFQAKGDRRLAEAVFFGKGRHLLLCFLVAEGVELTGINQQAVLFCVGQGFRLGIAVPILPATRQDDDAHFDVVLLGEVVVTFVMRRDGHDGAGAVFGEDVVGNPDGQALAAEWVNGVVAGVDAVLFDLADVAGFARLFLLL